MHSSNELNVMKLPLSLFKTFLFSRPCSLPSEIFCIKAVIVACLYAVSNSGPIHTYEQREQATITVLIQNISLCRYRI